LEERKELVKEELLDGIKEYVTSSDKLFLVTRGAIPHPGDRFPPPAHMDEDEIQIVWHVPLPCQSFQVLFLLTAPVPGGL